MTSAANFLSRQPVPDLPAHTHGPFQGEDANGKDDHRHDGPVGGEAHDHGARAQPRRAPRRPPAVGLSMLRLSLAARLALAAGLLAPLWIAVLLVARGS